MKLVIGLVGQQGAGKETFITALQSLLVTDGMSVKHVRFSDVLRETLTLWNIPHGRENEQRLAVVMSAGDAFKPGALSRATAGRIAQATESVICLEGIRWYTDEQMIRELQGSDRRAIIVYVDVNPEIRFERIRARNRSGAAATTWEDFVRQEQAPNEIHIPDIGSRADIVISNAGSREEFEKEVRRVYETQIRPLGVS